MRPRAPAGAGRRRGGRAARRTLVVAAAVGLPYGVGVLAHALAPLLLREAPLLLLALHPYAPLALLAGADVATVPFLALAVLGRVVPRTLAYAVGRTDAPAAERWLREHAGRRRGRLAALVPRFRVPALLVAGGSATSLLAGASGMALAPFLAVTLLAAAAFAVLTRVAGDLAAEPLGAAGDALAAQAPALTAAALAVLVVVALLRLARAPRSGDPRRAAPPSRGT